MQRLAGTETRPSSRPFSDILASVRGNLNTTRGQLTDAAEEPAKARAITEVVVLIVTTEKKLANKVENALTKRKNEPQSFESVKKKRVDADKQQKE